MIAEMERGGVEKESCEQYFHPQMELRKSRIGGRQIKGREKVSGERRPLLPANGREGAKGGSPRAIYQLHLLLFHTSLSVSPI